MGLDKIRTVALHRVPAVAAATETQTSRAKPELTPAVIAWRSAHGLIAVVFLASIAYIWWCALSGHRGPMLRRAVAALAAEGALVAANHGDCPLGGLGERIGDPVPLFELVLSPPVAKRAVPALGLVTAAGLALLAARSGRGRAGIVGTQTTKGLPC